MTRATGPERTPDAIIVPMLRGMQVIALACLAFAALAFASYGGPWSAFDDRLLLVYGASAVVLGVVWALRDRVGSVGVRHGLTVLSVLAATPVLVLGTVGFSLPALLLVIALAVIDAGPAFAVAAAVLMSAAGLALHLYDGNGWTTGLLNTVPLLVLLGFGAVLGACLRAYRARLVERDAAVRAAREAAERLRRAVDVEKELVLAEERARAARELHDGLGHRLTVIRMSLEFADRMRERDPGAAWEEIAAARGISVEAMEEMRLWVRALSPVRHAGADGASAFEAIAESFRGTGVEVTVVADHAVGDLAEETVLLLYRAVQEGLTNALRHARCRRADIRIAVDPASGVRLTLRNDLTGAAHDELVEGELSPGFGLRSLADRARALGGVVSATRSGDDVELVLALPAPARAACEVAA